MGIFARIARIFRGPRILPAEGAASTRRQMAPMTFSQSDWLLENLDEAVKSSDSGAISKAAKLAAACRRDGVIAGVLSTRTKGLLSLPRHVTAPDPSVAREFEADFDAMFPMAELEQLLSDGILLNIGVGEFVQPTWSRLPTLRRLDPERLTYRWSEDRWYYQSTQGLLPITPGDGRWFLYLPGGHVTPWKNGIWAALGRAYIAKQAAFFMRENYSSKLANAARVVTTPLGTALEDRQASLDQVVEWGVNAAFALPAGHDIKLIEANGRGYEVFSDIMEKSDREAVICLSGQTVLLDGGAGFQNAGIFASIRNDLIQGDALALAAAIIEQGAYLWGWLRGFDGLSIQLRWETTPPKDRNLEATAAMQAANAVAAWRQAGADVDVVELARRYGIPLMPAPPAMLPPVDVSGAEGAVLSVDIDDDAAAQLAEKMTEHAVERCQHGANNRCPKCGIERVRDFDIMPDGTHAWRVIWRAIPQIPEVTP